LFAVTKGSEISAKLLVVYLLFFTLVTIGNGGCRRLACTLCTSWLRRNWLRPWLRST